MSNVFVRRLCALLLACLLFVPPTFAAEANRNRLVTTAWLEQNRTRDDVLLIDASPAQVYAAKHIPGAIGVDVYSYGGRDVSLAEMEKLMQSWGVSPGKKIVIYDQGGTMTATSLFFDLYHHGVAADDLFVLDGGLAKWLAAGGAVTKDPVPLPKNGTFRVTKPNEQIRVRLAEFLVASGDPANNALVEALDPNEHYGASKFFDRGGHIPNAINLPSKDFFNADKTFKSAAEIEKMLTYLGIKKEQQIYTHCGGGIAASVPFFALTFLTDHPKVKLYKESQLEWLRDERGLPFWTYAAPNMLRDKQWLGGWNSQMLRMFGVTKLNIVDVRGTDAYKLGHVPYALNVSADLFRRHLANPSQLAELLGPAGIDAAQEAVIVSEGGLNPDSALAFLMLEKLGQKKVSLLLESVDDWGLGGFPLTKEPTIVGKRKTPQDLVVPTVSYAAQMRTDGIAPASGGKPGLYPKVFIASGKSVTTKKTEGNTIHLPYTELVNAGGTPKPAKEIWARLEKAGLPRYAEIIVHADDPGEAAVNYFILKLMGYPDVKVMLS